MFDLILDWSLCWILINDIRCCILIDDHLGDFPYIKDIS